VSLSREDARCALEDLWPQVLDEPGTTVHGVQLLIERPDGTVMGLSGNGRGGSTAMIVHDPRRIVQAVSSGSVGVLMMPDEAP